jgi:hypothetical protein
MRFGITAWAIQDAAEEFSVGEVHNFVLGFFAKSLSISHVGMATCKHLWSSVYEITGRVEFKKVGGLIIIDFGHLAYCAQKMDVEVGDWISGEFSIRIDCFAYRKEWGLQYDVPDITRGWRIDRIFLETTPRIEVKPKYFMRDDTRFSEVEVIKTNAWEDDEGNADYTFECTRTR